MRPRLARAIVWPEPTPRYTWAEDFPGGVTHEELEGELDFIDLWGTDAYGKAFEEEQKASGNVLPPEFGSYMPKWTRGSCTPDVAREMHKIWAEIDVTNVLEAVPVPTLLLVHKERKARYLAQHIPGARLVEFDGEDHWPWSGDMPPIVEEIEEFLTGTRRGPEPKRALATVLFTDIVGSTERSAELGDRAWRDLLQRQHAIVRDSLGGLGGTEVDTAGDGFYATFDGPARAIRCALDIAERVRALGVEIRAGIHTGECEVIDGKVSRLAVSIGRGSQVAPVPRRYWCRKPCGTWSRGPGSPSTRRASTS